MIHGTLRKTDPSHLLLPASTWSACWSINCSRDWAVDEPTDEAISWMIVYLQVVSERALVSHSCGSGLALNSRDYEPNCSELANIYKEIIEAAYLLTRR